MATSPSTSDTPGTATRWGLRAGLMGCALLLLVITFFPSLVRNEIDPHWGWNPQSATEAMVQTAVGPGGMAWLNVMALVVAAFTLALHVRSGGTVAWPSTGLAIGGCAVVAFHVLHHADNARLGTSWMAACAVGLAVRHLVEHDTPRRFLLAGTVAMAVPFFVDAASYVWVEHPMTVADYHEREAQILADRGFEEGSVQHRLFEERLEHADAVGVYGLSNVFGSVTAAMAVAGLVLGVGALAAGAAAQGGVALLVGGFGVWTVAMTRSKGAMISLALGVGISLLAVLLARRRPGIVPWLGPMVLALAFVAVIGRGIAGAPEDASGERSLLFRAHYWQAAAEMARHTGPLGLLAGRGPAAFARDYPAYKPPLNPEQVVSAHSMPVDHLVMLGAGGLCWTLLLVGWLMRAGQAALGAIAPVGTASESAGLKKGLQIDGANLGWATAMALPLFGAQYLFQHPEMDDTASFRWLAGAAGFVFVVAVLRATPPVRRAVHMAAAAVASLVLLLHAQIEMTFFSDSASRVAWFIAALAAVPATEAIRGGCRRLQFLPSAVLGGLALFVLVSTAIPVTRQESRLAAAAAALRRQDGAETERLLAVAVDAYPVNPRPYKVLARMALAARRFDAALAWIERAERGGVGGNWCHRFRLEMLIADPPSAPSRLDPEEVIATLLARVPHNCDTRLRIADALWNLNRRRDAGDHYAAALRLHEQTRLDPERQLTSPQLTHIRNRLALLPEGRGNPHGTVPAGP